MPTYNDTWLKRAPFIRLVCCFIAGILLQWYVGITVPQLIYVGGSTVAAIFVFSLLPVKYRFAFGFVRGACILLLFVAAGALATYTNNIRNNRQWAGNYYKPGQQVLLTAEEPLVEKPNSYKVLASVTAIYQDGHWQAVTGKAILYFYKGKKMPAIRYGSQIIINKPLQQIKNSGNPGEFDYNQYCFFRGITYDAYLYPGEFATVTANSGNVLRNALFNLRDSTISIIQKYVPGQREQGVAEALLIGYRANLDSELLQEYSNAGVIHIIAISGLHLGMIYGLLLFIFGLLPSNRIIRIVKPIIILAVLWLAALLAGATPSIMRAAIMFSFIIIGDATGRRTNSYNTIAASAFCLLVYNPFYLWDAGFTLSYAAVISIVTFYRPIYNWFYIKNKLLNKLWQAMSVNIAAQILTFPLIVFYFHQFSGLFLIANLVAVPLSCFILYGSMGLLVVFFIPFMAKYVGLAVTFLIQCMDSFIRHINLSSFAIWTNLQVDVTQTLLLYGVIICSCVWLLHKLPKALLGSLTFLIAFIGYTDTFISQSRRQQTLIVYNVSHKTAIDIIQGNSYHFIGDTDLLKDGPLVKYNLTPSRILQRVSLSPDTLLKADAKNACVTINHTKLFIADNNFVVPDSSAKLNVDVLVLAKNPKLTIADIQNGVSFKQLVFDGSNTMGKIQKWKKECDSLHLRFHSVPEQGAFIMNL